MKEMVGKRFERLVVISLSNKKVKGNGTYWNCECDCGNTVEVNGRRLRDKTTKSCGCLTPLIDISGQRFGKLVVVKRIGESTKGKTTAYWECSCDCGGSRIESGTRLRKGTTTHCGCLPSKLAPPDISGQRFGRLIVLKRAPRKLFPDKEARWECLCDCGNTICMTNRRLLNKVVKSCGCLQREIQEENKKKGALNCLIKGYKRGALTRSLEWKITDEEFFSITRLDCYYCGAPPTHSNDAVYGKYMIRNGVDRIDNAIGYLLSNCVPCCKECNYAKNKKTVEEFLSWIDRVASFQADKRREQAA